MDRTSLVKLLRHHLPEGVRLGPVPQKQRSRHEFDSTRVGQESSEPAIKVLDHVFDTMKIDVEWSTRRERGFTWWPHALAQHVWTEPPRVSFGTTVWKLCAEVEILRDVPAGPDTLERVAALNGFATLSALMWEPLSRSVFSRCTAYVHDENMHWIQELFTHAVALQAAEAARIAPVLAPLLGGSLATSSHPASGPRRQPDDMLNVIQDVYAPLADQVPGYRIVDFAALDALEPRPWVLATHGADGMTGELPFAGDLNNLPPTFGGPMTALLEVRTDAHPVLGSGTLVVVRLPTAADPMVANAFNLAEWRSWLGPHLLGGWCTHPTGLAFATFLPAATFRTGLLTTMVQSTVVRERWARGWFVGDADPTQQAAGLSEGATDWREFDQRRCGNDFEAVPHVCPQCGTLARARPRTCAGCGGQFVGIIHRCDHKDDHVTGPQNSGAWVMARHVGEAVCARCLSASRRNPATSSPSAE